MQRNLMKIIIVFSIMIFFGIGSAWAGGRSHYSQHPKASYYKGYHHHGGGWGYRHHGPRHHYHHYDHRPRYHGYRYYGPPAYYRYHPYYPGAWGGYGGAYYFSGGFSEPGFGFVFGTRGNW